jgi:hypothetical protein
MTEDIPGPAWIPAFLEALTATGVVKRAMQAAGAGEGSVYQLRKRNMRFADAWDAALAASPARRSPASSSTPAPIRSNKWRIVFLEALAETSNITASAVRANVPLRTVYKVRRADEAFAADWQVALHEGYDMLEMELLGYLRDPQPQRKMDVAAALRLLAAHRETVERRRALGAEEDAQAVLDSIDRFIDDIRERRADNEAILIEAESGDGAE